MVLVLDTARNISNYGIEYASLLISRTQTLGFQFRNPNFKAASDQLILSRI